MEGYSRYICLFAFIETASPGKEVHLLPLSSISTVCPSSTCLLVDYI